MAPVRVHVERTEDLEPALRELALDGGRPTVLVVGGAGRLAGSELDRLRPLFTRLAAVAERLGAAVVDGGTDAGVMRLLGRARAAEGASFPLVGVAARGLVAAPGAEGDLERLEPNHSHALLVPGERWGDETPSLVRVVEVIVRDQQSVTLLVNGGEVALQEVAASLGAGWPVVVAAGSGRLADVLAAAAGGAAVGGAAGELAASGLLDVVQVEDDGGRAVVDRLVEILSGGKQDGQGRVRKLAEGRARGPDQGARAD